MMSSNQKIIVSITDSQINLIETYYFITKLMHAYYQARLGARTSADPVLLTWFNFNRSMDK